ncbi:MAG: tetratricopeptide repeat protein [Bacteroidia bacterium]
MIKKLLQLILGLALTFPLTAQQSKTDSLVLLIRGSKEDSGKVNALNALAWIKKNSDPDTAFHLSNSALKLSDKLAFSRGSAAAYSILGILSSNKGDYEKALGYHFHSIRLKEKLKDSPGIATSLVYVGAIHSDQGKYPSAMEYYFKALKQFEVANDKKGMANTLNNIGNVHYLQQMYDKALEYYTKALKLRKAIADKTGMAKSYNNIGLIYEQQGKLQLALDHYFKSVALKELAREKKGMAYSYNNIGVIYENLRQFERANEYFFKSLRLCQELDDRFGMAVAFNNIGKIYLKQNKFSQAKDYLNKGLSVSREIGTMEDIRSSYEGLATTYSKTRNFEKAFLYQVLLSGIKDSILNEKNAEIVKEMDAKYETENKNKEILLLNKDKVLQKTETLKQKAEAEKQQAQRNAFIIGFVVALIMALFIYKEYREKQKATVEIIQQKQIIEEKNKDITDSIKYAKRIQEAIFPPDDMVKRLLPESFVLFKPKDIVSGDFYWVEEINNFVFFAAADCTGHGVPGAFMSIVGFNLLKHAINEHLKFKPSEILDQANKDLSETLRQTLEESAVKDGMDIVLCRLNRSAMKLEFAGANNPLYLLRDNKLSIHPGDKQPVGAFVGEDLKKFTNHSLDLLPGDQIYIFTDGYADQFGGPAGKKFKYKQFEELLIDISHQEMAEQKNTLGRVIESWKGNLEQVDDILIIGIRV